MRDDRIEPGLSDKALEMVQINVDDSGDELVDTRIALPGTDTHDGEDTNTMR